MVTCRGQGVQILSRGQLDSLQSKLSRGASDDNGEMIGGTRSGPQGL